MISEIESTATFPTEFIILLCQYFNLFVTWKPEVDSLCANNIFSGMFMKLSCLDQPLFQIELVLF